MKREEFEGPFVPHSDGSLTPKHWASLDGTLYVEEDGTPYMVFCHEWEDADGDGTVCAVELTKDLSAPVGEPRCLFRASEAAPEDGTFSGKWKTEKELLFAKDGGHGMLFTGLDGKRYLALHSPNETLLERPFFYETDI